MMPQFKNLNELAKYIDKLAKQSLIDHVAPVVKERMQEHVETDVYEVYKPKKYDRTGGLKNDIEIREVDNGVAIVPTRFDEDTGNYIPSIIESGKGYTYSGYGYAYEQPRPFVQNTKEEILREGIHKKELAKSLKNKGLDIR
jgi:hypothetical protein